ncbi:MAG: hypothetical protein IJS30_04780 [Bacteroidales bacterium]|nr:hypothetical protein [Bacteroidales bacterium]
MKRNLYVSPAIKEYGISLENAILQGSSEINPEVSIDDMNVNNINQW